MKEIECTLPPCQVRISNKLLSKAILLGCCDFSSPNARTRLIIKNIGFHLETIQHNRHIYNAAFTIRKKLTSFKSLLGFLGLELEEAIKKKVIFSRYHGQKKSSLWSQKGYSNLLFCSIWKMSTHP